MAKDGLFFQAAGKLNNASVPAWGLVIQGLWSAFYVLPRTIKTGAEGTVSYGNLYGELLTYVISAQLIFYILTIAEIYWLRKKQPEADRPYRAFGYPFVPALYIIGATIILVILFMYQTATTWPGLLIVFTGLPAYYWQKRSSLT